MVADFIHRILRSLTGAIMTDSSHDDSTSPRSSDDRRIDERFAVRGPCAYELIEGHGPDASIVHGKAYSLNVSSEGLLLLLDRKPQPRQLLEIHNPVLEGRHAVTLFEVRWSKRLPFWTTQDRYLVGCHLTFGRLPYFLFRRNHLDQNISGLSL